MSGESLTTIDGDPVLNILERAASIITDPKKWGRHHVAADIFGRPISPYDKDAVCWCAIGALNRARLDLGYGHTESAIARNELEAAASANHNMPVVLVNDALGHDRVMKTYATAITSRKEADRAVS